MTQYQFILSLISLGLLSTFATAQQTVVADLRYDINNHRTTLLYGTSITNGDAYNETNGGNTQGAIWLNRLNPGQDGFAEFQLDKFSNGTADDVQLCLVDEQAPGTTKYILKLNNNNVSFYNGSIYLPIGTYVSGDVFRIERYVDKIFYYKNDIKYSEESTVSPTISLAAKVEIIGTGLNSNNEPPRLTMSFPNDPLNNNFVQLKKKIDGSFFNSNRAKLRFTYVEKYAQESTDQITCNIYDWEGTPQQTASYPTVYGVNWLVMPLSNTLTPDEIYTLEVTGGNKDETYYLRFKY